MRFFLPLIVLALMGSAALGWLRAGTSAGAQPPAADGWDTMQYNTLSDKDYDSIAAKVKASALLPLSLREEQKRGNDEVNTQTALGPTDAPPFPKILGFSVSNTITQVHLLGPEDSLLKAKAGDVLDSGWEIKSIGRKGVSAVFDGQDIEVPIVSYLQTAFEKSEEDAMDILNVPDGAPNTSPQQRQGGGE